MFKKRVLDVIGLVMAAVLLSNAPVSSRSLAADDKIIGRWDMTVQDADGSQYPSWFEARREGGNLVGRFVGRVGSARPIKTIEFGKGHL
ncbi:MAG TPA: hypothetical protein VLR92_02250, partial [Blastocatellia bacterium]|nr:hypothetical protein [Blastocatellia bacterium]